MIQTMPASICSAIRSPFSRSSVHTDAPSPNRESFASRIASSSLSTRMIGTTGPKISSCMIRMSCVTPVSTVGAMKWPLKPGTSTGPPQRRVAPAAIASSTSSHTSSYCSRETIGPISVFQSSRIAHGQRARLAHDAVDEAVRDLFDHVDPLDPRAGLAGVRESAPHGAGDGVREVRVRAHDLGVLAAELEHRALQPAGALLADAAADLDRSGEEDLARRGLDQRLADGAAPVHGLHESLGQSGALENLLDPLSDERRERGGLQHHAVAGHQCDRDLAERDRPRVVPGGDHADDTERLVAEERSSSASS